MQTYCHKHILIGRNNSNLKSTMKALMRLWDFTRKIFLFADQRGRTKRKPVTERRYKAWIGRKRI